MAKRQTRCRGSAHALRTACLIGYRDTSEVPQGAIRGGMPASTTHNLPVPKPPWLHPRQPAPASHARPPQAQPASAERRQAARAAHRRKRAGRGGAAAGRGRPGAERRARSRHACELFAAGCAPPQRPKDRPWQSTPAPHLPSGLLGTGRGGSAGREPSWYRLPLVGGAGTTRPPRRHTPVTRLSRRGLAVPATLSPAREAGRRGRDRAQEPAGGGFSPPGRPEQCVTCGAFSPSCPPQLAKDLLHPSLEEEKRKHKKKRLVQSPNSYFMDVKCPGK